jgi:hypothetical protein
MTDVTKAAGNAATDATDATDATPALEPSQAEIDAWAEREKARRQAWLSGPTEDERAQYAKHVRQRRLAQAFDEGEFRLQESMRLGLHYGREAQLAAEGAMSLFYRWSRRTMAELVKAGRDWEEDTALPRARRRVPMDDDAS